MERTSKWVVPNDVLLSQIAENLRQGERVLLTVRGNSMNPVWVDRRDQVELSAFHREDAQSGVVVLAGLESGGHVLHRIIKIAGERVTLQGDGNLYSEEQTEVSLIMARVTAFVRNGKKGRCDSWKWKTYSWMWMRMYPMRRWLLAVWRILIK